MTCGAGNPVTLSLYSSPVRAIPQPSAPEGLSNFRTLRTFGAKGSVNPHASGVSMNPGHAVALFPLTVMA